MHNIHIEKTVYEVLLGECNIKDAIVENIIDNLDILPSNVNLAGAEIDLIDVDNREYILKESILEVRDRYDYIILDCPPSLSMLTVNAMTAADTVLESYIVNTTPSSSSCGFSFFFTRLIVCISCVNPSNA